MDDKRIVFKDIFLIFDVVIKALKKIYICCLINDRSKIIMIWQVKNEKNFIIYTVVKIFINL